MSKQTEALKLALEALERHAELGLLAGATITAIREALADSALDRMAENARELGLDYDAGLALWDAINKREFGNPTDDKLILDHLRKNGLWIGKYTSPPASKPWEGLTQEDMYEIGEFKNTHGYVPTGFKRLAAAIEAKLREKNT